LIQKAGGGTGFAFDELRPPATTSRAAADHQRPDQLLARLQRGDERIQQGAFRRGANMG